ncbi:unnamed protein product [Hymenolepis diminuta]|uniref:Mediator of RNA polymerase II transcription subunit 1 n=1 Tax=Hymenolepis diminuta TaxID=6216 RepID=A0A564Z6E7_HYMDI|nr:unnamed protein product [Hymenolepis diminuta]
MSYPPHPTHSDNLTAYRQVIENGISSISRFRSNAPPDLYRQHVRFATLRNQLFILAQHYDLQLADTGPLLPPGASSSGGIAWRLAADCFSVVISAIPADGYSLPPGTTPPEDYPVSVAAVHFEFNQDKPIECSVLTEDIRKRIYYSLWKHVKNLIALYNLPGEIAQRCRAYLCLQALEQDLIALTTAVSNHLPHPATPMSLELTGGSSMKVANTSRDVECLAQSINGSAVGQVVPRTGGCFSCLTYYISPARRLQVLEEIHSRPPTGLKEGSESGMLDGYCASVGLRATANRAQHSLPLVSLVNLTKDADGYNVAQFTTADNITRVTLAAEFFLKLNPPLLFDIDSITEVEAITKIPMDSIRKQEPQSLRYILLCQREQEGLASIDPHFILPNRTQHSYHVLSNSLRGYLVGEIAFTCPSQLPPLIQLLRQKASWLSFVETFMLHPKYNFDKDPELTFHFKVGLPSQKTIIVNLMHPLWDTRMVEVSIDIGDLGVSGARLSGAVIPEYMRRQFDMEPNERMGSEEWFNPTAILSQTHNLPIAMTWLLIRLGCPATRVLTELFPYSGSPTPKKEAKEFNNNKIHRSNLQSKDLIERAISRLHFSNDAAANGVLSGADKISKQILDEARFFFLSGNVLEGIVYDPTANATPNWPAALQPNQQSLPPPPQLPTQQIPQVSRPPLLPPGVMATTPPSVITPDQLSNSSVPTPKQVPEDTFPTSASNNQGYRSIPIIPGVMATPSFSQSAQSMRPPVVSTPTNHTFKPQTPASCGPSMLVSLLDEDSSPQSLPPPPHVGSSAIPPNRIISSPVSAAIHQQNLPSGSPLSNSNHSAHTPPTYLKSSGSSSDVLNHLLTSSSSTSSTTMNQGSSSGATVNPSQSAATKPASITPSDPLVVVPSKKGRKRRMEPPLGATFISALPTRATAMENMKQSSVKAGMISSSKPPPLTTAAPVAKVSVYDFEDCPPASTTSTTSITPPPPLPSQSSQIPPQLPLQPPSQSKPQPFVFNEVTTTPERTTEMKSSLKFVIKTNRACLTGSNPVLEKASSVPKPRTKTVESKPVAYLKQMQQHLPSTSTTQQYPKKERKKRVSSKIKEAVSVPSSQPSLVMSISSPKVFPTNVVPVAQSPQKKHGLMKNKTGRKKTLSTSSAASEPKRHRLMPLEESQQPLEPTGSLGGGNGTNRLIKGYKIPKVRKLSTTSNTNASPSLNNNQEDSNASQTVSQATTASGSSIISPSATGKAPQRSLLYIVENLREKRAVEQSQSQQTMTSGSSATVNTYAAVDGTNSADDTLPLVDSSENLFEKFGNTATPNKPGVGSSSSVSSSTKRLKSTPPPPPSVYDQKDPRITTLEDTSAEHLALVPDVHLATEPEDNAADAILSLDTHSDSQTPPASMDEESVSAGGLIKAPTDTPDSPTESLSSKAFVALSKIIPVTQESTAQPPSQPTAVPTGPFYHKSLPPGRPGSNATRGGGMPRGTGPRFNHLRGSAGWGSRPFNAPMMPRGASGGGPGSGVWGGPPPGGIPPPSGGNWGSHPLPPRASAPPLYRAPPPSSFGSGGGGQSRQPPSKN